jgi:hypothetical protein
MPMNARIPNTTKAIFTQIFSMGLSLVYREPGRWEKKGELPL